MAKLILRDDREKLTCVQGIISSFLKDHITDGHTQMTPFSLCDQVLDSLGRWCILDDTKNYLIISNLEFLYSLYSRGAKNIWFATSCDKKAKFARKLNAKIIKYSYETFEETFTSTMKFDVIVGNPPYQLKVGPKKTEPIWQKFVHKAFELCKEDGYVSLIHPSGWRNVSGKFKETQNLLKSKDIKYLEMHDERDGVAIFGAATSFDWYCIQNRDYLSSTEIFQDGRTIEIDLRKWNFIPNSNFDKFKELLSGECGIDILYNSAYHTQRPHMSEHYSDVFKYPVIYSTPLGEPSMWWSSTNDNGHYGIPKFIFNPSRPTGYVVDKVGKYAMSQFCVGIVGESDYIDMVERVFLEKDRNEFGKLMESTHFTDKVFDCRVFTLLNVNIWKKMDMRHLKLTKQFNMHDKELPDGINDVANEFFNSFLGWNYEDFYRRQQTGSNLSYGLGWFGASSHYEGGEPVPFLNKTDIPALISRRFFIDETGHKLCVTCDSDNNKQYYILDKSNNLVYSRGYLFE